MVSLEAKIPAKTLSNLIGLNTGKDIGNVAEYQYLENGPVGSINNRGCR